MSGLLTTLGSTHSWAPFALSVSWQLALFALLAWALERLLRQPRARYALWWFVLLAPLVLTPLRAHLEQRQALVAFPAPPALARATAVSLAPVAAPPAEEPIGAPVIPVTPTRHSWYPQALDLLKDLWLLAALVLSFRLLIGYRQIRLLVKRSRHVADEPVLSVLRDLCARAGVRSLALRASADVTAAVLCGVRHPVILVPEGWLSELAPEELRALLAHEVAHVRRRDVAANLAQRVLEALLSLHPGTWLVSRRITTAREEACDAWAIGQGADPAEYARCLARAAARAQARFTVASVGLAEGTSRLRQRVEAVMRLGTMGAVSRRVAIAVVIVLAVCALSFAAVRMVAQPGRARITSAMAPQNEATVIQSAEPLSGREAEAALEQLGLDTHKLVYEVPFAHEAHLNVEEYRHGKLVHDEGGSVGGIGVGPGRYTFLFFTREIDEKMTFSYSLLDRNGGGGRHSSSYAVSLHGVDSRGGGGIAVTRFVAGKRTPFWYLAATAPGKLYSSYRSQESLPAFIARNDLVVIAYLTLLPMGKEAIAAAAPRVPKDAAVLDITVLLDDGTPAAEADIMVERTRRGTITLGHTDPWGKATVSMRSPGAETRLLVLHDDPIQEARQTLHLVSGTRTALTVKLVPPGQVRAAPTVQGDSATLDLAVIRADGTPAAGAALTVEGRLPWEGPRWRGETDAQGKATAVIEHPAPGTRPLRVSYRDPTREGKELIAVRLLILSPGTRTSATVTVPSRGAGHIESAPRNAQEAAARAKRDRYWAELQERQKAEHTYWRQRRAEVAAMPVSTRRAMMAEVQARLHQLKAKARPLEARAAELDKLEQAIVNKLREIEAESPGAQTPEGTALRDRFNKIAGEQSAVGQQLDPLLDQRSEAERELYVLQAADRSA